MFFHIDESGNTGMNLFDANQRRLSCGVRTCAMATWRTRWAFWIGYGPMG